MWRQTTAAEEECGDEVPVTVIRIRNRIRFRRCINERPSATFSARYMTGKTCKSFNEWRRSNRDGEMGSRAVGTTAMRINFNYL